MDIKAFLKRNPIVERGGVLFFSEPPSDILPSRDEKPTDQRTWSYWRKENYRFLNRALRRFPGDAVLIDVGAGQSEFAEITQRFVSYAVDFFPYPGVDVVCDFSRGMPFKNQVADIVLLTNMLEHVREPDVLLAECFRILKPGGALIGTVPFMIQIHQRPYDFYRYTDINLKHLFSKHQFADVEITAVSNLFVLLFNTATSFFTRAIEEARFKLPWRVLWKIVRTVFSLFWGAARERFSDADSPLGYLFEAWKEGQTI